MPYKTLGQTVINKKTGKVMGKSPKPKQFLKALYANTDTSYKKKRGNNHG